MNTCRHCGTALQAHSGRGRPRSICHDCRKAQMREYCQRHKDRLRELRRASYVRRPARTATIPSRSVARQYIAAAKIAIGHCQWPDGCVWSVTVDNVHVFDFDHREPSKKSFALSKPHSKTIDQIQQEIDKCDLLCANHHRLRTQRDRHHRISITRNTTQPQLPL